MVEAVVTTGGPGDIMSIVEVEFLCGSSLNTKGEVEAKDEVLFRNSATCRT